jgi:hypothetical protein
MKKLKPRKNLFSGALGATSFATCSRAAIEVVLNPIGLQDSGFAIFQLPAPTPCPFQVLLRQLLSAELTVLTNQSSHRFLDLGLVARTRARLNQ